MRRIALALAASLAAAPALDAQPPVPRPPPTVRALFGIVVPTGSYGDLVKASPIGSVQAAVPLAPWWVGIADLTFIAGETRFARSTERWSGRMDIVQFDLGAELRDTRPLGEGWWLVPFAGAGAGLRAYVYRHDAEPDVGVPIAYGVGGAELRSGRGAVRFEVREHVFRFRAVTAGASPAVRVESVARLGIAYQLP